jgi:hypothetical protein
LVVLTESFGSCLQEEDTMFTKTTVALAVILATASGALAATKTSTIDPGQNVYTTVYNPAGAYVGTDPNLTTRFELNRDWGQGN